MRKETLSCPESNGVCARISHLDALAIGILSFKDCQSTLLLLHHLKGLCSGRLVAARVQPADIVLQLTDLILGGQSLSEKDPPSKRIDLSHLEVDNLILLALGNAVH
jgi:hypothetical protein